MTDVERAAAQAAGLRQLADMIEAHPEIDAYYLRSKAVHNALTVWLPDDAEDLAAIARAALAHGAKVDKDIGDQLYTVVVSFGPIRARAMAMRDQVCERVVVGTEEVTETVKDPDALAKVPEIEVTEEREIIEWRCTPLLEATAGGAA